MSASESGPVPIVFAHRGGMAHAPQNTVAAFSRAVGHGAGGIETDAFLTRDGVVALTHDAALPDRPHPVQDTVHADLPLSVPTLDDLFDVVPPELAVFIDVKDVAALPAVAATARRRRDPGDLRLYLAHADFEESDWELVAGWAADLPGVHLVDSTSVTRMDGDPAAHLRRLADSPISWLNLPIGEWTPQLVADCRAAGLRAMAFRVHDRAAAERARELGLDAVHGDDVLALVDAFG